MFSRSASRSPPLAQASAPAPRSVPQAAFACDDRDDQLECLADTLSSLKMQASGLDAELAEQNSLIDSISAKTSSRWSAADASKEKKKKESAPRSRAIVAKDESEDEEKEEDDCDLYDSPTSSGPAPPPPPPAAASVQQQQQQQQQQLQAAKPKLSPEQALQALVALQEFDGSFALQSQLCTPTGTTLHALQALVAELALSADAVATAVAIAFFESKLAHLQDDWQLIVNKARKWLVKNIGGSITVGVLVERCASLL